jgi:hypothetical protein
LIATRNITIEILNETYPRDDSARFLREGNIGRNLWDVFGGSVKSMEHRLGHGEFGMATSGRGHEEALDDANEPQRRRTVYIPDSPTRISQEDRSSRELVYFTDEYAEKINLIFNNPFCVLTNPDPDVMCAIASSTVCVLMEKGDNEEDVREVLIDGIEEAIENGEFAAAIPPEHKLPDEAITRMTDNEEMISLVNLSLP